MRPKVIILRGPGTNCDVETAHAFFQEGAAPETVHVNTLRKNPALLKNYSVLCIPGGFTYGDDISAGRIFANEMMLFLKDVLEEFIRQDKLILGICNGFQVLVKTGILPDMDFVQKVTLGRNSSLKFEARWVWMKTEQASLWTKGMERRVISLPVAHGEGRLIAGETVLERLEKGGHVLLRYADEQGREAGYPYNPNGSARRIAGIVDKTGRVFGLMPHPERFLYEGQHPFYGYLKARNASVIPWGRLFFRNAVAYVKQESGT